MSPVNTLEIPQDILDTARLTIDDLKVEMAVYLYAQGRLSIGKARELAEMTRRPLVLWERGSGASGFSVFSTLSNNPVQSSSSRSESVQGS